MNYNDLSISELRSHHSSIKNLLICATEHDDEIGKFQLKARKTAIEDALEVKGIKI